MMKLMIAFILLSTTVSAQTISFKIKGKEIKRAELTELKNLLPSKELNVLDTNERAEITYKGFEAKNILEFAYGKTWSLTDELLITCADGYQPSLPIQRLKDHRGFLAFERLGQKEFELTNRHERNKTIKLGPLYFVWDNLKTPVLQFGDEASWPYQVVSFDLVSFKDRYPKMSPPEKSNSNVKKGFVLFRQNCMPCHTINGQGGKAAPELNYPANVTEYIKDEWVKKWISDPASIRLNTPMPGLSKDVPKRAEAVENIYFYLKAMKSRKLAP